MTLTPGKSGFWTRLRYGKGSRDRFLICIDPKSPQALDLAIAAELSMQTMATQLARAGDGPKARELLTEAGRVASDPKKFKALCRAVDQVAAEVERMPAKAEALTFRGLVDLWTSGKLRELYPDAVRAKTPRGHKIDRATLAVFFPALGSLPMAEIAAEHIDLAKRAIPSGLDPDSRRLYLVRLRTAFRYARKPLRAITTVLDEVEDLPPLKPRNLFWFLYPEEDALLLACTRIPLAYRVLYGWLHRNGTRIAETLRIDYDHLDLTRGRVRLEAEWTKTGRARFWDLERDVHSAMRLWRLLDREPQGTARVFHSPSGKSLHEVTVSHRFLGDLRRAGVTRAELHLTTKGSRRLRVHDTRSGFCTMARRRGMPDTWTMDRSGHESVQQLEKYARFVRHADEQGLDQWFAPLDQAIPELRSEAARVGQAWASTRPEPRKRALPSRDMYSIAESVSAENQPEIGAKAPSVTAETPPPPTSGPASFQGVGQVGESGPPAQDVSTPEDSPVEHALAAALQAAIGAQRWDLAQSIVMELGERRRARVAPGVPSLADARRKKDEGK